MSMSYGDWLQDSEFQIVIEVLADARASDERLHEAGQILEALEKLHPQDPVLIVSQGRLLARWGQLAKARELYHRAQELSDPGIYPSPWLNEAILYDDFKFFCKAADICNSVLLSAPKDPRASALRATCIGKRRTLAAEYGLTREDITSGDPFVLDTLELLLAMGVKVTAVKGRVSDQVGLLREIDILAEIPSLHFLGPLPLVIECKDWTRPVDRPVVDKCVALADHSKYKLCAIVARQFSHDAVKLASASGVWLVSKEDLQASAESFLWRRLQGEPIRTIRDYAQWRMPETDEERKTAEDRRKQEEHGRERLRSWIFDPDSTPPTDVVLQQDAVHVDGVEAIPLEWNQHSCLTEALAILGAVPFFVKILYLGYFETIYRQACPKWAR